MVVDAGSVILGAPNVNGAGEGVLDGAALALLGSEAEVAPKRPEKGWVWVEAAAAAAEEVGAAKSGFAANPFCLSLEAFSDEPDENLKPPNGLLAWASGSGENK